jgi:hypothetical protein
LLLSTLAEPRIRYAFRLCRVSNNPLLGTIRIGAVARQPFFALFLAFGG